MEINNGKKYNEAIKVHATVVEAMKGVGYGLLKDGKTFYRMGMELAPREGITFSMRDAYEIHRFLSSRDTEWEVTLAPEGTPLAIFQKERTDAISEMFDNEDEYGIFPTGKFFARLDKCFENLISSRDTYWKERVRKEVEDYFDIRLEDLVNEHLLNEDPHTETRIFEAKKNRDEILTITNEDNLK